MQSYPCLKPVLLSSFFENNAGSVKRPSMDEPLFAGGSKGGPDYHTKFLQYFSKFTFRNVNSSQILILVASKGI